MDLLEGSLQILGPISQHGGYIRDLKDNVTTLMKETDKLKRKRDEVEDEVNAAESVGKKRRCDVGNWLQDVDEIVAEIDSIQSEFDRGKANVLSRHNLGKRVVEKIEVVKTLQDKGLFDKVAKSPRRPQMPEFQVPRQLEQQSTADKMLKEIEEALFDEEIGVVCVCGMGGIGKTTLMKQICNRLAGNRNFDVVIWVTVSQNLNLNTILQTVGNKLEVQFPDNEDVEDKRDRLYAHLRKVKYMLILDDLWEAFSLDKVGIPRPDTENGCKIAITSRSIAVSSDMEAHNEISAKKILMKTLTSEEAWDLFCSKTGDAVLLPRIKPVAEEVVKECGGLPLAIQTVGAAMRGKEEESLWRNALRSLKGSAPEVRGMERQVFLPLKLSYDSLEDSSTQFCFLCCALFPEDYQMYTDVVVRYWVFEAALIDKFDRVEEALNKGHDILDRLKDACLLESAKLGYGKGYVKMHDLLRDLAIWITSQSSSPSSKFLVKSGLGLGDPPEEKNWEGVGRISLMSNTIQDLQIIPNSPDLVSLFLCNNWDLRAIRAGFFQHMPQLRILDLSRTGIRSLPPSLSHLVNLRALILTECEELVEIPPLGELKELQLLDLSATGIQVWPEGIENLVKLKQLDMSFTTALDWIPCNSFSALTCLEHLGLEGAKEMGVATWREVTALPRLVHLDMTVPNLNEFTAHDIGLLGSFSNLKRFRIYLGNYSFDDGDDWFDDGKDWFNGKKTILIIDGCRNFPGRMERGPISHVEYLSLTRCNTACLSQPLGCAKSLRKMRMHDCEGVECIIDWRNTEDSNALDCLEELDLGNLSDLENIFYGGPPLPSTGFQRLRQVSITGCPKLRCVFSSIMVGHLHQLKYLRVQDCGVKCIIDWRNAEDSNALGCLEELDLGDLPDLENIFHGGPPLPSTGFQRLHKVSISGCPKLRCVFSSCMVGHLHQLQRLEVVSCEGVEEIVQGDTLPDDALQRLSFLHLSNLPKLSSMCRAVLKSLEEIRVDVCPELKQLPPLCSAIQGIGGWVWGPREWWERMEWGDDDHSKSIYSTMLTLQGYSTMITQQSPMVQTDSERRDDEAAHTYEIGQFRTASTSASLSWKRRG